VKIIKVESEGGKEKKVIVSHDIAPRHVRHGRMKPSQEIGTRLISPRNTLVQNRFFTTESQRAQRNIFLFVPVQPEQIKSLLSLQNRDPILCQGPVRRLRFYFRREGIYDPIPPEAGLDHKKSSSAYSVAPW
jgi:hypothetical protein